MDVTGAMGIDHCFVGRLGEDGVAELWCRMQILSALDMLSNCIFVIALIKSQEALAGGCAQVGAKQL